MIRYRDVMCMAAPAFCCTAAAQAEPVTIEFRADRSDVDAGEKVNWTVWGVLPTDAPTA